MDVDNTTLFDLILSANFLNIPPLLELTCQAVANQIKGKTPEEIREIFHIEVCAADCRTGCACAPDTYHNVLVGWLQGRTNLKVLPLVMDSLHTFTFSMSNTAACHPLCQRSVGSCLQNDFTPEEEEQVRRENQWAFE